MCVFVRVNERTVVRCTKTQPVLVAVKSQCTVRNLPLSKSIRPSHDCYTHHTYEHPVCMPTSCTTRGMLPSPAQPHTHLTHTVMQQLCLSGHGCVCVRTDCHIDRGQHNLMRIRHTCIPTYVLFHNATTKLCPEAGSSGQRRNNCTTTTPTPEVTSSKTEKQFWKEPRADDLTNTPALSQHRGTHTALLQLVRLVATALAAGKQQNQQQIRRHAAFANHRTKHASKCHATAKRNIHMTYYSLPL